MKKFLSAKWIDLIMANYAVDPELLADRVPTGTEIDLHEGKCYVSLVAFMFLDTRVFDFLVPFHINFEEVNLRFYVKREMLDETRRGVVFAKEIVPRSMIVLTARLLYGEPYEQWKMSNFRDERHVRYSWESRDSSNSISVGRGANLGVPSEGSHAEFITEHYWGYTKRRRSRTDEYKVEHPKWEIFEAEDPRIMVDFGRVYGERFAKLSNEKPDSVLLAKGSDIAVYKGSIINGQ